MLTCPACGTANGPAARFCSECGVPLAAAGAPAHEERRTVTVLFADLAGFTARSERLDPEDVRAFLVPYYDALTAEVTGHGGRVDRFLGDGIMAVFGAPVAHEDDPERAVRAALRIAGRVPALGLDLHVRVGVNTGEVLFAAAGGDRDDAVTGDPVNTAARLQAAAPPDGVVVGEATWRATSGAIRYETLGPVAAKGKAEPVPLWRAVGPVALPGWAPVDEVTPLLDRDRELQTLVEAFDRSRSTPSLEVVTVVAEPGLGKSRLVRELARRVDELPELVTWRAGRCLPYGEGIGLWALSEIVKAQAGILDTDGQDALAARLDAAITEPDPSLRRWMRDRLAPLVGLGTSAEPPRQEEAWTAWRRFLESVARKGPLVLVVEDLHWADEGLVGFLGHLADTTVGLPVLLVVTARPEVEDRHPGWLGRTTVLRLPPLDDDDIGTLLAGSFPGASPEVAAAVLERAAGSPLYAEQLAAMARERGGTLDEAAVPPTLAALLASRIDMLHPDGRAILLDAAVVGKTFWPGAVAAVGGRGRSGVEALLTDLARRDLIKRVEPSSMADEAEYAFVHALLRDAAYGQLTRAARLARHQAAAAWVAERASAVQGADAEIVAAHLGHALELAEAIGASSELPAIRDALVEALLAAADQAMRTGAGLARVHLARALELLVPDDPRRPAAHARMGQALSLSDLRAAVDAFDRAADAYRERGDFEAIGRFIVPYRIALKSLGEDERADRVLADCEAHMAASPSPGHLAVLGERAHVESEWGDPSTGKTLATRALELAADLALEPPARVLDALAVSKIRLGDRTGEADLRRAAERSLEEGDPERAIEALIDLGIYTFRADGPAAALPILTEAVSLGESRGHWGGAPFVRFQMLAALGRWDEVLEQLPPVLAGLRLRGDVRVVGNLVRLHLAMLLERGDPVALELTADDPMLERLYEFDSAGYRARYAALRLDLQLARGEQPALGEMERIVASGAAVASPRAFPVRSVIRAGAPALAGGLLARYEPEESRMYRAECLEAGAMVAEAMGELEEARVAYAEAVAALRGLGEVWEAAHALAGLGRCLLALGESAEGAARLCEARGLWAGMGAAPRIAEIDELLAPLT